MGDLSDADSAEGMIFLVVSRCAGPLGSSRVQGTWHLLHQSGQKVRPKDGMITTSTYIRVLFT